MNEGLWRAIARAVEGEKRGEVVAGARAVSEVYRGARGRTEGLVTGARDVLGYAAARMPATYEAVSAALGAAMENYPEGRKAVSVLDVGAGTGAGSWAADALLPGLRDVVCLEREPEMIRVGRELMAQGSDALRKAEWIRTDIGAEEIGRRADIVIAGYVLNEVREDRVRAVVERLWGAAGALLLIVEPGTPERHRALMEVREQLAALGGTVVAPCAGTGACPMEAGDWCHFRCRVARSALHRDAKGGAAPFEDEKYAYLAVARGAGRRAEGRVLRHPVIHKGNVALELCTEQGVRRVVITKKMGDVYKRARKIEAGGEING